MNEVYLSSFSCQIRTTTLFHAPFRELAKTKLDCPTLEGLMQTFTGKVLHKNHWYTVHTLDKTKEGFKTMIGFIRVIRFPQKRNLSLQSKVKVLARPCLSYTISSLCQLHRFNNNLAFNSNDVFIFVIWVLLCPTGRHIHVIIFSHFNQNHIVPDFDQLLGRQV